MLDGGNGDDLIYLTADTAYCYMTGGAGNDTIYGIGIDAYRDVGVAVNGGRGNDTIHGGDGDDHISGGLGNDTIYGGNGNDTVYGKRGRGSRPR